jgi:hypothetical protein
MCNAHTQETDIETPLSNLQTVGFCQLSQEGPSRQKEIQDLVLHTGVTSLSSPSTQNSPQGFLCIIMTSTLGKRPGQLFCRMKEPLAVPGLPLAPKKCHQVLNTYCALGFGV